MQNLIKLVVHLESINTDGHKSALKAIRKALPEVTIQHCLVSYPKNVFALADEVSKV